MRELFWNGNCGGKGAVGAQIEQNSVRYPFPFIHPLNSEILLRRNTIEEHSHYFLFSFIDSRAMQIQYAVRGIVQRRCEHVTWMTYYTYVNEWILSLWNVKRESSQIFGPVCWRKHRLQKIYLISSLNYGAGTIFRDFDNEWKNIAMHRIANQFSFCCRTQMCTNRFVQFKFHVF